MFIKVMLIIFMHALIIYCIKEDLREYFKRMENDSNNRSIKKKLIEVDQLNNTFENVG